MSNLAQQTRGLDAASARTGEIEDESQRLDRALGRLSDAARTLMSRVQLMARPEAPTTAASNSVSAVPPPVCTTHGGRLRAMSDGVEALTEQLNDTLHRLEI